MGRRTGRRKGSRRVVWQVAALLAAGMSLMAASGGGAKPGGAPVGAARPGGAPGGGAKPGDAPPGVKAVAPDNAGLAKLICASPYGGPGHDDIVGVAVLPDRTIVLAGNRDKPDPKKPGGRGFLLSLTLRPGKAAAGDSESRPTVGKPIDMPGAIEAMKLDVGGNVALLIRASGVYLFKPGSARPIKSRAQSDATDFGLDSNGELVVLHGPRMTRYDKSWGARKWSATWHAYGDNRPGGMAVCPQTGIAAVVGYGMTHTGREPWKDPFAYGFDRAGKQVWKLWDPVPSKQVASEHGGTGLMADTSGSFAAAGRNGKLFLGLYADGGNSVCNRDPADPQKNIAPGVFADVHQSGPGHGFKGASKTSVVFRVDAATGRLEKGTWMCAWLTPARGNALGMAGLAADEGDRTCIVGDSAWGCPTKQPWFYDETAYRGGGFLAIFDVGFRMLQGGFFQQTSMTCVATGGGYIVIGGSASRNVKDPGHPLQVHKPIQDDLNGQTDGYFAVFQTGSGG